MAEPRLPTNEEIAKLPRWARVAFAARCARRAQPLFIAHWPTAPEVHLRSIEKAITIAERSAAAAAAVDGAYNAADGAYAAAAAAAAADGAYAAARASAYSAAIYFYAAAASYAAADAAARAGVLIQDIKLDFDSLMKLSKERQWRDYTPVPPSVFPHLATSSLNNATDLAEVEAQTSAIKLVLDFEFDEYVDPEEVRKSLVALFRELNEYSLLKWGKGLTIDEFKHYVAVGDFAGAR